MILKHLSWNKLFLKILLWAKSCFLYWLLQPIFLVFHLSIKSLCTYCYNSKRDIEGHIPEKDVCWTNWTTELRSTQIWARNWNRRTFEKFDRWHQWLCTLERYSLLLFCRLGSSPSAAGTHNVCQQTLSDRSSCTWYSWAHIFLCRCLHWRKDCFCSSRWRTSMEQEQTSFVLVTLLVLEFCTFSIFEIMLV